MENNIVTIEENKFFININLSLDINDNPYKFCIPTRYKKKITSSYINLIHKKLKEAHEWSQDELKSLREF